MPRLGYGEYDWSDPDSNFMRHGRVLFLDRVRINVPEVLDALRRLLPEHWEAVESMDDPYFSPRWPERAPYLDVLETAMKLERRSRHWEPQTHAERVDVALALPRARLLAELGQWAQDWYLLEPWVLDTALRTLISWTRAVRYPLDGFVRQPRRLDTDALERLRGYPAEELDWVHRPLALGRGWPSEVHRFVFEHPGWDPSTQLWADRKTGMEHAFKASLKEYELAMRQRAESKGMVRIPVKYRTGLGRGAAWIHFDWLARHQVGQLEHQHIANAPFPAKGPIPRPIESREQRRSKPKQTVTVKEIEHACRDTARLIHVTLRSRYTRR